MGLEAGEVEDMLKECSECGAGGGGKAEEEEVDVRKGG